MLNKKSQVGETVTWTVATISIITILLISTFAASILPSTSKKTILKLDDKQKDYLATKSIIGFLERNKELIESSSQTKDFGIVKNKFEPFLLEIPVSGDIKGWNMEVKNNCEKDCDITTRSIFGKYNCYDLNLLVDDTIIRFWTDFQGGC